MSFKIEKIPAGAKVPTYPLEQLKVNESFFIPCPGGKHSKEKTMLRSRINLQKKNSDVIQREGRKFKTVWDEETAAAKKAGGGLRVGRVQ